MKNANQEKEFVENFSVLIEQEKGKIIDTKQPVYYDYDIIMKEFSSNATNLSKVYDSPNGFEGLATDERKKISVNQSIYSPAESIQNTLLEINDVPSTTLFRLSSRNLSLTSALFCALMTKVLYKHIAEKHP